MKTPFKLLLAVGLTLLSVAVLMAIRNARLQPAPKSVLLDARDSVEFWKKKNQAFRDSTTTSAAAYEKAKATYDSIADLTFRRPDRLDPVRDSLRAAILADIRRQVDPDRQPVPARPGRQPD